MALAQAEEESAKAAAEALKAQQDEQTQAIIQEKEDMIEQVQSELEAKRIEIHDA